MLELGTLLYNHIHSEDWFREESSSLDVNSGEEHLHGLK